VPAAAARQPGQDLFPAKTGLVAPPLVAALVLAVFFLLGQERLSAGVGQSSLLKLLRGHLRQAGCISLLSGPSCLGAQRGAAADGCGGCGCMA
jgi:hypothetical protein